MRKAIMILGLLAAGTVLLISSPEYVLIGGLLILFGVCSAWNELMN